MKRLFIKLAIWTLIATTPAFGAELLVEAESFTEKGGWVVDQQFMDLMGSPYLMAHGLGRVVEDAKTSIEFTDDGRYSVYVRTYNWTSPWYSGKGAGRFTVKIDGKALDTVGDSGDRWQWQKAGEIKIKAGSREISLSDMTGFNGRCDAIYFTTEGKTPPETNTIYCPFRERLLPKNSTITEHTEFDLVVVGAGVAGISCAVSAARLGSKVALINDRPLLGGNNSSEIRVHLGGSIDVAPYKRVGDLLREYGPSRIGNAQPADYYEDSKKDSIVAAEPNITLFANNRAFDVKMDGSKIKSVITQNIESAERLSFSAPLFADCTGDGTIGYLAGAHYRMGREAQSEFHEPTAPQEADKMTMGSSVQWYSVENDKSSSFPEFNYGVEFNGENFEEVTMGEWTWETGMNYNQIDQFERIRDYGLMVVFSNWSYLKNHSAIDSYRGRSLEWVAYIAGKRESRRLMGDYILKETDMTNFVEHEDGTASTTWSMDLHYPDPNNTKNFPDAEFKSIAKHIVIHPYPVPYRCLYSRNVDNLFMAGRDISVTHVALGTIRVMRTTSMLGEVVGMASSLCRRYNELPRQIYWNRLEDLKELMRAGVGNRDLPNNQKYNEGGSLGPVEKYK